jgi:protein-disulfide isomerase
VKTSWLKLCACLLPLTFTAATCKREQPPEPARDPVVVAPVTDAGHALTADLPMPTANDLPGIPVEQLPEAAAKQLFAFAQDDFCFCGCPHTVQGCLKDHASCRHARRMMMIASAEAVAGAKSAEITRTVNDYYGSFAPDKRATIDLAGFACRGPATAPITVVEYSDFECPYCRVARPILEALESGSGGKVRLCFKPFPLQAHPHSGPAAEAAMYALSKGKFWPMHDLMFENQQALDTADLKSYAQKVGLDGDELLMAIASSRFAAPITASKEEGKKAGVQGTPAIYVNGRPLSLPFAPELLQHAIDDELEWQQNHGHWAQD